MLGLVLHSDTKIETATVEIKRPRLEHGFACPRIEIAKGDNVVEKRKQIPLQPDQLIDVADRIDFRGKRRILGQQ